MELNKKTKEGALIIASLKLRKQALLNFTL